MHDAPPAPSHRPTWFAVVRHQKLVELASRPKASPPPWLERAYVVYALLLVLVVALDYYGSLHSQLLLSAARAGMPSGAERWSAPLDDVFIHFDFARSTARGYPFQWSEGNGYSSGGTSLLYPFVLALGYRLGFTGNALMHWAAMVACVSVWATLVGCKRLLADYPPILWFLLPPCLLSVGALNWSLFSGMEVSFFLAVWTFAFVQWWKLRAAAQELRRNRAMGLGLACALLVATRPEAAILVALLTVTALPWRSGSLLGNLTLLTVSAGPGALVTVVHALANKYYTGDFSAAGAIVKLELNHPYLEAAEIWNAWKFHFWYQFARVTNYHFSDLHWRLNDAVVVSSGWGVWVLAALPLWPRKTRSGAAVLWCTQLAFMALVALNGQVRWQNERYTMPAVAWLLLNASTGIALAVHWSASGLLALRQHLASTSASRLVAGLVGLTLTGLFVAGQVNPARGQRWFFGRASRNILDQHVQVGRALRRLRPNRVLLSDAGAIPYASDLPALDIIGLGGYHDLPFARASNHGVGAVVELLQRMPPETRPDLMALYPSWWRELPLWFGKPLFEATARGNVVCGAASKVVYRPDWHPLVQSDMPDEAAKRRVVLEVDVADLVSEHETQLRWGGSPGFVAMKLLPNPRAPLLDLFDAGRVFPPGSAVDFVSNKHRPLAPATLVLRSTQTTRAQLNVAIGAAPPIEVQLEADQGWHHTVVEFSPALLDQSSLPLRVEVSSGEVVLHHLWLVQ